MSFDTGFFNLGHLDAISYRNTAIHRLDPRTKVIAAFAYVMTVVSFPKYAVTGLLPFFIFPVLIFALGDIPVWFVARKVLAVSVFAVFVGICNPLFDNRVMYSFYGMHVSGGWVSFCAIIVKCLLTISAALLLIATTSFPGICHALRKLGMPELFIAQLLFLYRYIFVLVEEAMRMVRAREMRSFGTRGHGLRIYISLIGTLFIRTIERAERIHHAMLCRGFTGTMHFIKTDRFGYGDAVCLAATGTALFVFRSYDIVGIIGRQAESIF